MFSCIIPSGLFDCQSNKGRSAGARCMRRQGGRKYRRHCEQRSDEAIHLRGANPSSRRDGLLRGACHRAALRADPLARNDGRAIWTLVIIRESG
jgi:hypothetical protein